MDGPPIALHLERHRIFIMPKGVRLLPLPLMLRGLLHNPLYRNAYALLVSTGASAALGMLYWVLAATLYSVESFGLNAAAISVMMFLSGISQLNLVSVFNRFIPTAGPATRKLVVGGYAVSGLLSLVSAGLYGLSLRYGSPEFAQGLLSPLLLAIFMGATVAWTIFALQDQVLAGLRAAAWVPVENIAYGIVKLVVLVALHQVLPDYGIFASWTLPTVLAILPINTLIFARLLPRHLRAANGRTEPIVPRMIAKFVAGNYIGSLFALASARLLPVLVAAVAGVTANAYFYLAWTIANTLHQMATTMSISLTVEGALDPTVLTTQARAFLRHKLQLLLPLVLVLVVVAPALLRIAGGEYAREATTVFRLLTLATLPRIVTALYLSMARVRHELRTIVAVQAASCLLTLALSFVLLPRLGITGVGLAFLVSESIVALVILFTTLRPLLWPSAEVLSPPAAL